MRHLKKFNHLSRTSSHRKAMLSNMAASLILHKRITTTVAKAKALRSYVEPLINKSKDDTTHSRRVVFSHLQSKEAVTELFREVAQKVATRPGGYTRIIKTGNRLGDNADMCLMELVDYNQHLLAEKESATDEKAGGRRRRRGSGKGKKEETSTQQVSKAPASKKVEQEAPPVKEEPQVEEPKEEKPDSVENEVKQEPEVKEEIKKDEAKEPESTTEEEPKAEIKQEDSADEKPQAKAEADDQPDTETPEDESEKDKK
jgi:large subunit ribosomal protein L17